jgi:hypothetical protein
LVRCLHVICLCRVTRESCILLAESPQPCRRQLNCHMLKWTHVAWLSKMQREAARSRLPDFQGIPCRCETTRPCSSAHKREAACPSETSISICKTARSYFRRFVAISILTMKINATRSTETTMNFWQTARRHIPLLVGTFFPTPTPTFRAEEVIRRHM